LIAGRGQNSFGHLTRLTNSDSSASWKIGKLRL
jgi:hypothetical protein